MVKEVDLSLGSRLSNARVWSFKLAIYNICSIYKLTCFNSNHGVIFVIPNKTRDPCIQIIVPGSDVFNYETSLIVSLCPELIPLKEIKNNL